jgi:iron complex outermembrane recepter protein
MGLLSLGWQGMAQASEPAEHIEFRITAPTMIGALLQFSEQARLQVVVPTAGADQMAAPKVQGVFTPRGALEELLRESGLRFEFANSRTVAVSVAAAPDQQVNSRK